MKSSFIYALAFLIIMICSLWHSYKEGFVENVATTKHLIDMPLTTKTTCHNICSPPTGRCSITGENCSTDDGCSGCKPIENKSYYSHKQIIRDGHSGKLSFISSYSSLTTDMARQAQLISHAPDNPPRHKQGKNTWKTGFDAGQEIFNKRYYEPTLTTTQKNQQSQYKTRNSATGEFEESGPQAANFYNAP